MAMIRGGLPVNYQKMLQLAEHTMEIPNILGIPTIYNLHIPAILSLHGTVKAIGGASRPELVAKLTPRFAYNIHEKVAFKAPFTTKKYECGIKRQTVVELPLTIALTKPVNMPVTVAVSAGASESTTRGQFNIFSYEQYPYNAIVRDELYPVGKQQQGGNQMQIIKSQEHHEYTSERTYGQKYAGMAFTMKHRSDYRQEEETQSGWAKFVKQFHSPSCWFNVGYLGSPLIKYAERKVVLNMDQSQTKTFVFALAASKILEIMISFTLNSRAGISSRYLTGRLLFFHQSRTSIRSSK